MNIDLRGTLRRRKPAKRISQLVPRPTGVFARLTPRSDGSSVFVLDTNIYIGNAADHFSPDVTDVIDGALLFHCSVALAELACGIANADPARPGWIAMQNYYAELFDSIPESRLLTPDAQIWTDAAIIAGTLARVQKFQPHQRKECLNDALIFLTAAKAGIPVLTTNRNDFDLIQQLAPEGQFILC